MQKDLDITPSIRKSADSKMESANSTKKNDNSKRIDQSKNIIKMQDLHASIEKREHDSAELDLDNELKNYSKETVTSENLNGFLDKYYPKNEGAMSLSNRLIQEYSTLGRPLTEKRLTEYIEKNIEHEGKQTVLRNAIVLKEDLASKGKSKIEILKTLIDTYKYTPELKTFVENWRNFLELWQFAETKSPTERKAITSIISNSDFTSLESFEIVLSEIEMSNDISSQTKLLIQRKFKTTGINTVSSFDQTLKQESRFKEKIEKQIQNRHVDIKIMPNEIERLHSELDKLPADDPKRFELESSLEEKGERLKTYHQELSALSNAKPKKVEFQLRNDLIGELRPDGSRFIRIATENFNIQLPPNNLPFMGTKSLRAINTAFPYLVLRSQHISDEIFSPDLIENGIPKKGQREIAHLILTSLGVDDSKIISERDLSYLKKALSFLIDAKSGKTGRVSLIELGIYSLSDQRVNKDKLQKALQIIRENHGEDMNYQKLKEKLL